MDSNQYLCVNSTKFCKDRNGYVRCPHLNPHKWSIRCGTEYAGFYPYKCPRREEHICEPMSQFEIEVRKITRKGS